MKLEILKGGNVRKNVIFYAKEIQKEVGNISRVLILLVLYNINIFSMLLESFKDGLNI